MPGWTETEGSSLINPPERKTSPINRDGAEHYDSDGDSLQALSSAARERILSTRGEPLFLANWERTLMMHFEVEAGALQKVVPFEPDLRDGRAFVSVVAFKMSRMRPHFGGRVAGWLLKPIATHDFLNVRTYVRVNGEVGIHFMTEWLSNRLSVMLGPRAFGLPYRFGKIRYDHNLHSFESPCHLTGHVTDAKTGSIFAYRASLNSEPHFRECERGSLSEWLMERYTAFTSGGDKRRFFRVWHQPWPQAPVDVCITKKSLLEDNWPFFRDARLVGANFSPGVFDVWMGWPHRVHG